MGSLESQIPLKKASLFGAQSSISRKERLSISQRIRSSFSRLLFKKLDYVQWICTVLVFLFFIVVFQMFLPSSVIEKSENSFTLLHYEDLEKYVLDIEESTTFLPKISQKFNKDVNLFNRSVQHFGYRKPHLALVSLFIVI